MLFLNTFPILSQNIHYYAQYIMSISPLSNLHFTNSFWNFWLRWWMVVFQVIFNTSFLLSLGITIAKPHFNGCYGTIQKIALGQIWVAEEILGNTKNFCFSSYFKIQGSVTNTVNKWFANSKHVFFLFYYLTFVLTNCIFQNYYNFLIGFLAWCHSICLCIS